MDVLKRDNVTVVKFDRTKISSAIMKAMNSSGIKNEEIAKEIAKEIEMESRMAGNRVTISFIEKLVFDKLIEKGQLNTARAYENYRSIQAYKREVYSIDSNIEGIIDGTNEDEARENSNKNEKTASTQRDLVAGQYSRDWTRRKLMPVKILEAHDQGLIHFHDSDYEIHHIINCCLINIKDMLANGTVINKTLIETPHMFRTACTITTQIIQQVANGQYGGQTISVSHLAPYLRRSKEIYLKEATDEVLRARGEIESKEAKENIAWIVDKRLAKELDDGVQTIQYQINTFNTSNGQAPFLSIFMYISEEPEYEEETVMIIKEILRQRTKGIKNEKGVWIPPSFPKLLYVMDENNIYEGSKYFDVTVAAAKCISCRMVPDLISAKKMKEKYDGEVFPCMGCLDETTVVTYMMPDGSVRTTTIGSFWNVLTFTNEIMPQTKGSPNVYMDTPGVKVFDPKRGFVDCNKIIRNISEDWCKITLDNGATVHCTADHPWETVNRETVLADGLTNDDVLMYNDGESPTTVNLKEVGIASIVKLKYADYSYDVETESEHFQANRIYSHNCRSFLIPYKNPETGKYQWYGRFNQGVVTLNLPDVGLSANGDLEKFWEILDERMELCKEALMLRHERLLNTPLETSPIHWKYGAIARLNGSNFNELLFNGYSTISLGYAGLCECIYALIGESNTTEKGSQLALDIITHMSQTCEKWYDETNIGFSLYGTPLENTTYKFAKCLKNRFGIIPHVTDKDYITNSYHVHVSEEINPFEKLAYEAPFQNLSSGGCISYIEMGDMKNNIEAIITMMQYMYETIRYSELNGKFDNCHVCSFEGEIKQVFDPDKNEYVWECPQCRNRDHNKMNVTRRTCGYLGNNFWNKGRTDEIHDRYNHLDNHEFKEEEA